MYFIKINKIKYKGLIDKWYIYEKSQVMFGDIYLFTYLYIKNNQYVV